MPFRATVNSPSMLRAVEMKLYPTAAQEATLHSWLRSCCTLYNRCLEQRIKAYRRRGEAVSYARQCAFLTGLRQRVPTVSEVPAEFARDALRRLDRGFQAFFRRVTAGEKPGFPRYRAHARYNSLEYLAPGSYVRPGGWLHIPRLGLVRFRAGDQRIPGRQRLLRIIRRASGWFGQVLLDDGSAPPPKVPVRSAVGVDVGLSAFATLSTGEKIDNPRYLQRAERKLRRLQRRLARCSRGSRNRPKAVRRVARAYERIAAQRKDFAHQTARRLVNRFDLIGFEALNVKGLAGGMLAKPVHDAAWAMFTRFVAYKAEYAGKWAVPVNPGGTSRECPSCGAAAPKELSERVHRCRACGLVLDRDEASARVILARAVRVVAASACGGSGLCAGATPGVSRPGEAGSPQGPTPP